MKSLRKELYKISNQVDILFYEQFLIDFVQEELESYEIPEGLDINEDNGALAYKIGTILEIIKEGKTKNLFLKFRNKSDEILGNKV
jgi:hypothetical protein